SIGKRRLQSPRELALSFELDFFVGFLDRHRLDAGAVEAGKHALGAKLGRSLLDARLEQERDDEHFARAVAPRERLVTDRRRDAENDRGNALAAGERKVDAPLRSVRRLKPVRLRRAGFVL